MDTRCKLRKGPHQPATRLWMKALIPLISQLKGDEIGDLNYQMQCTHGWGLKHPVWKEDRM